MAVGQSITATATPKSSNLDSIFAYIASTSEFSACRTVAPAAGITVSPTSGLVTTEAGGTATLTVELQSPPTADVTIPLSSSTARGYGGAGQLDVHLRELERARTVTITGRG